MIAIISCFLLHLSLAGRAQFYVSESGTDVGNNCQNVSIPCLTLRHLFDDILSSVDVNVTVYLNGTFSISSPLVFSFTGPSLELVDFSSHSHAPTIRFTGRGLLFLRASRSLLVSDVDFTVDSLHYDTDWFLSDSSRVLLDLASSPTTAGAEGCLNSSTFGNFDFVVNSSNSVSSLVRSSRIIDSAFDHIRILRSSLDSSLPKVQLFDGSALLSLEDIRVDTLVGISSILSVSGSPQTPPLLLSSVTLTNVTSSTPLLSFSSFSSSIDLASVWIISSSTSSPSSPLVVVENCPLVTISDLRVTGSQNGGGVLLLRDCDDVVLSESRIEGNRGGGAGVMVEVSEISEIGLSSLTIIDTVVKNTDFESMERSRSAGLECRRSGDVDAMVNVSMDDLSLLSDNLLNDTWRANILCPRDFTSDNVNVMLCTFYDRDLISELCGDPNSYYATRPPRSFSLEGKNCDLQRPCSSFERAFSVATKSSTNETSSVLLVSPGVFPVSGTFRQTSQKLLIGSYGDSTAVVMQLFPNSVIGVDSLVGVTIQPPKVGHAAESIVLVELLRDVVVAGMYNLALRASLMETCTFDSNTGLALSSTVQVRECWFSNNHALEDRPLFENFRDISSSIFDSNDGLLFQLVGELKYERKIDSCLFVSNDQIASVLESSCVLTVWNSSVIGTIGKPFVVLGGELRIHGCNVSDSQSVSVSVSSHEPLPILLALVDTDFSANRDISLSIDASNCPIEVDLLDSKIIRNEASGMYVRGKMARVTLTRSEIADNTCYDSLPTVCGLQCFENPTIKLNDRSQITDNYYDGTTTSNLLCPDSKYPLEVCEVTNEGKKVDCLEYRSSSTTLAITLGSIGAVICLAFSFSLVALCLCVYCFLRSRERTKGLQANLVGAAYVRVDNDYDSVDGESEDDDFHVHSVQEFE